MKVGSYYKSPRLPIWVRYTRLHCVACNLSHKLTANISGMLPKSLTHNSTLCLPLNSGYLTVLVPTTGLLENDVAFLRRIAGDPERKPLLVHLFS